ncbi:hypothetical protein TESG_08115 [Trichophyton tonsurans CBS 112818]|uniref:RRM domain-containing protein n=1 Tax=Trichophyton tonsurans (strain CBS 112818) TaxID=647933 RepID=F2SB71_TRIT1|nr:hypothetical protein TESG_08115 [Trichophyton tonsurans CBS 112818]
MGDKRNRDEAAVDENDGAVLDLGKSSKKIKSGDKEKVKKERKTKKDKKEKKEKKKLEKELKKKAKEEANGAADEDKMEVDGEPNGVQKAEKSKKATYRTPPRKSPSQNTLKSSNPTSVRVPLERGGKKGRGFAFVEFAGFDRMKTCLKQYHGTMFEDGDKPARKINVELTAGGGGSKSEARKMKILEKNQKLNEERARDAQEAKRAKTASATTNGAGSSAADDQSHIHPSRRARVPV